MNLVERMAVSDWFRKIGPKTVPHIDTFVHKISGGRFTMSGLYTPVIILTTIGRKSGEPRQVPVLYLRDGASFWVMGSSYGRPRHPAWSANLLANPDALVQVRGRRVEVRARPASDDEKKALWPRLLELYPAWEAYATWTDRSFRLFCLEPR